MFSSAGQRPHGKALSGRARRLCGKREKTVLSNGKKNRKTAGNMESKDSIPANPCQPGRLRYNIRNRNIVPKDIKIWNDAIVCSAH